MTTGDALSLTSTQRAVGDEESDLLSLSRVVGGQLSSHPPLFTADSAHFLCIASSSIKLFSVRTGQQLRVISPPDHHQSHTANVTSLALSPKNPLQVYSSSVDGSIRLWDINDGALLKVGRNSPLRHRFFNSYIDCMMKI
jgi:WD40 repeat protein